MTSCPYCNRTLSGMLCSVHGYVGPAPAGQRASEASAFRQMISVKDYGAKGNGTANDTSAIKKAIAARAASGGTIFIPSGKYLISDPILVPNGVNLWGEGMDPNLLYGAIILCSTADSVVAFGERAAENYGGTSGNFAIDGNGVADVGLYLGLCVGRTFQSIQSEDSAIGLRIQDAQNCTFITVQTEGTSSYGVELDYGCGGNAFFRCGINDYGTYGIYFHQTGASSTGAYAEPTHNNFYSSIVERGRATSTAAVYCYAGDQNAFADCVLVGAGSSSGSTVVKMTADGSHACNGLTITNGILFGDTVNASSVVDGMTLGAATTAALTGTVQFQSCRYAFAANATAQVDVDNLRFYGGTVLASDLTAANINIRKRLASRIEFDMPQATDPALVSTKDGGTSACWNIDRAGNITWYTPDSWTPDTYLFRASIGKLGTSGQFVASDGLTTFVKAGVPADGDFAQTPADGTIAVDTSNNRIYVRVGGAWKYAALT